MLKKLGIPMMVLAGLLAVAPGPAKAGVRFGIYAGAPVYTAPACTVGPYGNTYCGPYAYGAPAYNYGYGVGWGARWGGWHADRDDHHDWDGGHAFRGGWGGHEEGFHGGGFHGGRH